jgi:predicted RNA binding protein YcfA (HicA-like mRNA interferase family)
MTRLDKLVDRIRAKSPEADFSDVQTLLIAYGWQRGRQRGSHVTFVKEGEYPISIPLVQGRRVKRTYLVDICERLGFDA